MVILVSYDLNKHERPEAYEKVKQVIEANAIDHKKPLYSQWLVKTDESVDEWYDRLKEVMDDDDYLFILRVQRPYKGYLSKSIWPWLSDRI